MGQRPGKPPVWNHTVGFNRCGSADTEDGVLSTCNLLFAVGFWRFESGRCVLHAKCMRNVGRHIKQQINHESPMPSTALSMHMMASVSLKCPAAQTSTVRRGNHYVFVSTFGSMQLVVNGHQNTCACRCRRTCHAMLFPELRRVERSRIELHVPVPAAISIDGPANAVRFIQTNIFHQFAWSSGSWTGTVKVS